MAAGATLNGHTCTAAVPRDCPEIAYEKCKANCARRKQRDRSPTLKALQWIMIGGIFSFIVGPKKTWTVLYLIVHCSYIFSDLTIFDRNSNNTFWGVASISADHQGPGSHAQGGRTFPAARRTFPKFGLLSYRDEYIYIYTYYIIYI